MAGLVSRGDWDAVVGRGWPIEARAECRGVTPQTVEANLQRVGEELAEQRVISEEAVEELLDGVRDE